MREYQKQYCLLYRQTVCRSKFQHSCRLHSSKHNR
ncbi:MAG: DUF3709 domain-containing protein [Clostridia bacterium]|nr:DUF3709 domain-containing protein [Clostridia bacterium]